MTLPKLIAGVVASLLMSLIWWLASPKEAQQSVGDLAALRTPVTLTLATGEQVGGELQGADSLCADWNNALQADPQLMVRLPGGRSVSSSQIRGLKVGRFPVAGALAMGSVSACGAVLTVHALGSSADGLAELKGARNSADQLSQTLKTLGGP